MNSDIIFRYFPEVNATQKAQFQALEGLYKEWNAMINVISRKDIDELYLKHVLHSLAIAKVSSFAPNAEILDVGTGGGFPGIPLAILFPEAHFHLVDSIGKKIKVVENVVEQLDLKNVKAEKERAEQLSGQYDFVVSRAVTSMAEFHRWTKGKIRKKAKAGTPLPNGILALKGGDLKEELAEVKAQKKVFNIGDFFEEPFFETKKIVYIPG